ncbi:MAG TPA: TIGR02530 family flagellar biosynthesis protein [Bacillus sp. (in: firmicutes)]|nr:TIGR02530 family flagellar biosynthesis protein [Bacillus sp. (in: firmicutes)]
MGKFTLKTVHTHPIYPSQRAIKKTARPTVSFGQQFQEAVQKQELKISKHAQKRMDERDIQIDSSKWQQLEQKVTEAKKKGVHDSLVLMKDVALIVSAKNNTIVTAMNRDEAQSQIFTNINGTILMD